MEIRSILVAVGLGTRQTAASYAGRLAERFGAELIGVSAAEPVLTYAGIDGAGPAAEQYAIERENIEAMLVRAETNFRSSVPASVPVKWRGEVANVTRALIGHATAADLIVTASEDHAGIGEKLDHGHLLLAAGRPVILAHEHSKASLDRIAVAWKDTREARRAVFDAMPLLRQAKTIDVISRSEGETGEEAASLRDIAAWLERHGVPSNSKLVDQRTNLLEAIGASGPNAPDLVVSGGYGHSRFREWLFGGVTRDLLGANGINRLLSY